MNLDIHADSNGTLRFLAQGKGVIATLSYEELSILHSLDRFGVPPTSPFVAPEQDQLLFSPGAETITVHMRTRTVAPNRTPASTLVPSVEHLQALELVSSAPRRKTPGLVLLWPFAPLRLTRQGRRLLRGLKREWEGWPAYTRRFPL